MPPIPTNILPTRVVSFRLVFDTHFRPCMLSGFHHHSVAEQENVEEEENKIKKFTRT